MPLEAVLQSDRDPHSGFRIGLSRSDWRFDATPDVTLASERRHSKPKGLRARTYGKHVLAEPWHSRVWMAAPCGTGCRLILLLLLLLGIAIACFTLPIDKILNGFLMWIHKDLGAWGPVALALAYIPLTVFAVPASILTIGGGYLFGLSIGFLADSIGATFGATAAFLVGRTVGRSIVTAKLKDYPQFQVVSLAVQRSGFKIVLLLRLVPILPFNALNYLLSITPVTLGKYMLASWIGMMPITLVLVYVGTTIKDLSDISHKWGHFTTFEWVFLTIGLVASVVLILLISQIARRSLDKSMLEIETESTSLPVDNPSGSGEVSELRQPLMIRIDPVDCSQNKKFEHPLLD